MRPRPQGSEKPGLVIDGHRIDYGEGWCGYLNDDGVTIFAPLDGVCGWSSTMAKAALKVVHLKKEGLWS